MTALATPAAGLNIERHVPSADELWGWLTWMTRLGPRLTGSPAHRQFLDFLAREFAAQGLDVARDPYTLTRWDAKRWSLRSGGEAIKVASYYPLSGRTGPTGVTGELIHVGDVKTASLAGRDVRGKIVLVDFATEAIPHDYKTPWGSCNPNGYPVPHTWPSSYRGWVPLEGLRQAAAAAGALGLIVGWTNISEDNAADQYQPILPHSIHEIHKDAGGVGGVEERQAQSARQELPALWVAPAARARLAELARTGAPVTMVLEAEVTPDSPTDSIVATLPGMTDETVMVVTHTDGLNATQENGPLGLLALAKCFAGVPKAERSRTLVFSAATAHLVGGLTNPSTGQAELAETEGVLMRHPELLNKTVAGLGLEHLGVTEWLDDGQHFRATGRNAWNHCITSSKTLADIMLRSLHGTAAEPVMVVDGRIWGMPHPLAAAGIPTIGYGAVGDFIMSAPPDGHIGKLSKQRLHGEITAFARLLAEIDRLPAEALRH